jgi:hypothetical protein
LAGEALGGLCPKCIARRRWAFSPLTRNRRHGCNRNPATSTDGAIEQRQNKPTMKANRSLHIILTGGSCLALLIYVLACTYGRTSFSPDDRLVLYPSVDPQNRALSIALYDRDTGRSEQIFSAPNNTNTDSAGMHAEWLPDGKHILVVQAEEGAEPKGLNLSVMQRGVKKPVRRIFLPGCDSDAAIALMYPFAMVGNEVFLTGEREISRVNWMTGKVLVVTNKHSAVLLPGGDGKTILGFRGREETDQSMEFGVVDPKTLTFKPHVTLKGKTSEGSFPHFEPATGEIYFLSGEKTNIQFCVQKEGKEKFLRPISRKGCQVVIAGMWPDMGRKKDRVFTAYFSQAEGQTNYEYGLLEIPLNKRPLRFTPLFQLQTDKLSDVNEALPLIQPSLSHDGRTWAVSSAWLAVEKDGLLRREDVALYLAQVDGRRPKVTKVPIALPADEKDGKK